MHDVPSYNTSITARNIMHLRHAIVVHGSFRCIPCFNVHLHACMHVYVCISLFHVPSTIGSSDFEYYTGFATFEDFAVFWKFLDPVGNMRTSTQMSDDERQRTSGAGPHCTLTEEDQLLIVLIRLRVGSAERDLAIRFGVSESTVCRIFQKWINYLYLRLGSLPIWPSWESVEGSMPNCFKESYPTTFAIIDATELFCEVPASLSLQSQCYSSYKSHTTMKGLVGIAPNGAIVFISTLYNGSISDRELTIKSGFLDLLPVVPKGKAIMADRGFDIQDLLAKHDILLNIPPFKGAGHLQKEDVIATQRIASVRIHVERVIGQVKQRYHLLQGVIPLSMVGSINQIWTVCCLLTNYRGKVIAEVDEH